MASAVSSARPVERIAFGEFADREGVSRLMRSAFEMHVRLEHGQFNFRTLEEWRDLYRGFLNRRRARHHG